jgi:3-methyladenine DNA glycosylase AlkD
VNRYPRALPPEQEKIVRTWLAHTRWINNWDLVDSSAPHLLGRWLLTHPEKRDILDRLAVSEVLWERRIAMVATYALIREQQLQDTLRIAAVLLNDPHDLIHKATGWMLRELGNRAFDLEVAFLDAHYRAMPRTMLRYAIEKFPEPLRQAYLKGNR